MDEVQAVSTKLYQESAQASSEDPDVKVKDVSEEKSPLTPKNNATPSR